MIRLILILFATGIASASAQDRRAMAWEDVYAFRGLTSPAWSDDAGVLAWEEWPQRGDGEVVVKRIGDDGAAVRVARGRGPTIAADGRFAACRVVAPFDDGPAKDHVDGLALVDVATGVVQEFARVRSFAFTADGAALVRLHAPTPPRPDVQPAATVQGDRDEPETGRLVIEPLAGATDARITVFDVEWFALAADAPRIAYARVRPDGVGELVVRDLPAGEPVTVHAGTAMRHSAATWSDDGTWLVFVHRERSAPVGLARLASWTAAAGTVDLVDADDLAAAVAARAGGGSDTAPLCVPRDAALVLDVVGRRVFFGARPLAAERTLRGESDPTEAASDLDALRAARRVVVWHHADGRIASQRAKDAERLRRRTALCVHDLRRARTTILGDARGIDVGLDREAHDPASRFLLGTDDDPHLALATWDGEYRDVYRIDTWTGERTRLLERHGGAVSLSPDGRWLVAWDPALAAADRPDWWLLDVATGRWRNLTADCGDFRDPDWDYPAANPGCGLAGWTDDGRTVLLHDATDVWSFPTAGGVGICRTAGHGAHDGVRHRVLDDDPQSRGLATDRPLLVESFAITTKHGGFGRLQPGRVGIERMLDGPFRPKLVGRSADGTLVFTRESYAAFPDLWLAPAGDVANARRASDLDRQRGPFAWGTSQVVHWRSSDGVPLDGALILPDGHPPGTPLPVLVYFYRFFSQRAFEWNQPLVNHRPCFALYASHGYAIFLPDVRFEIGRPGMSAVECVVPGVQRLVDLGIADPDRVALHGHSWSGYQTAFAITQSDAFACAIAGAPVANMTSAYGAIRRESGRARQFQYERAQSRLGASLWQDRAAYIDNSPLFFADRVNTPLLIQFGDADGAVPWEQGIELFLALRRLGKPCVLLQYEGEPHHLQRDADRLDYAMRMKAFLDHFLTGTAAPDWWSRPG